MTWIRIDIDSPEVLAARQELQEMSPPEYSTNGERLPDLVRQDSIVLAHSLIPGVMKHFFSGLAELMAPGLPLVRREHELIASTVSALNACTY